MRRVHTITATARARRMWMPCLLSRRGKLFLSFTHSLAARVAAVCSVGGMVGFERHGWGRSLVAVLGVPGASLPRWVCVAENWVPVGYEAPGEEKKRLLWISFEFVGIGGGYGDAACGELGVSWCFFGCAFWNGEFCWD